MTKVDLHVHSESTAVVEQDLHPIALVVAEDEEMARETILAEHMLGHRCEPVGGAAHVGRHREEEHTDRRRDQEDH